MTLEINKEIKTHVVLTMNKNKYFITEEQELFLRTAEMRDSIYTNTGMFKVHQITEILPIEEYYTNNPGKRPEYNNFPKLEIPKVVRDFSEERRQRALKNIIKGFKNYFSGREIPGKSQKILEVMLERLKA